MSEPICKCGHGKTWHRDQAGACIHLIDGVNDCDCKGYALPEPTTTLRDQFAIAALTGMVSGLLALQLDKDPSRIQFRPEIALHCVSLANDVYRIADAMILEREAK